MDDTIYRQAAIDALDVGAELLRRVLDETDIVGAERAKYEWGLGLIESCIADVKDLPSAQPEQRWIPATERLPEEYGEYICTMENGQVQECGFVPENQRGLVDGWSTCEADGHKFLGYADVLAWMPLPEPWKEGEADAVD